MATLNRHSLREELDALEAQFEALCAEGKVNADSRALFQALLRLFKLLMAVFMEKTTPKGNASSSLPSSQAPDEDTALARPATKGKGPAHNDARAAHTRTIEHVERIAVEHCARCGEDLRHIESHTTERRTRIDIVFEKTLTPLDAERKHCPRCHTDTRAPFPSDMSAPIQYGDGLKAYVVHLLVAQMVSLKRTEMLHATSRCRCCGRDYVAERRRPCARQENRPILRNIISCVHIAFRKAIRPLFSFHGRSGSGSVASHSAIALAFISRSISA